MLDFIPAEDAASLWGLIPEHATPTSDKLKLILSTLFFFRSSIYMLKGADTNAMWHRCQTTKTSAAKQYISANNQASPSPLFHISLHIYFCLAPDPGCSGCKGQQELLNWKHRASQKAEMTQVNWGVAQRSLPPLRSQCHHVVTRGSTTDTRGRKANNTRPITQQGGSPSLIKHEGKAQVSKSLNWNTAHCFNLLLSFLFAFLWSFFLKEEDLYLNMSGTTDVWKHGTRAILTHTAWSQQRRKA